MPVSGNITTLYADDAKESAIWPRTSTKAVSDENGTKLDDKLTALTNSKQDLITANTDLVAKTIDAGNVYLTTAPTADNNDGLKFVVLSSAPATKYNGYIYFILG